MPRLDEVHRWRHGKYWQDPETDRCFSQVSRRKSGCLSSDESGQTFETAAQPSLTELCTSVHRAVADLAASCPEITVFVKTKGRERDRSALPRLLGVDDEKNLPRNMRLVHGGSPLPLIQRGVRRLRRAFHLAGRGPRRRSSRDRPLVRGSAGSRNSVGTCLDLGAAAIIGLLTHRT